MITRLTRMLRLFSSNNSHLPASAQSPDAQKVEGIKGVKNSPDGLYALYFTCNICKTQDAKTFSKRAYHDGVVLIRCEGCDKLHLVADNLGWFRDTRTTIEDIAKEKGVEFTKLAGSLEFALKE
jgi:hypothetical protein